MNIKHLVGLACAVVPLCLASAPATAAPGAAAAAPPPLVALPALDVSRYMGVWYQVAWFPNRFQKQCVADTRATYRLLPQGRIEVLNRCRQADGTIDEVLGIARPAGSVIEGNLLKPAQLEVNFLPDWLRWLPVGWGSYWVLQLGPDGRYAVIGEPTREYLWVLSRTPQLAAADESAIRSGLQQQGYNLSRWQAHPQSAAAEPAR